MLPGQLLCTKNLTIESTNSPPTPLLKAWLRFPLFPERKIKHEVKTAVSIMTLTQQISLVPRPGYEATSRSTYTYSVNLHQNPLTKTRSLPPQGQIQVQNPYCQLATLNETALYCQTKLHVVARDKSRSKSQSPILPPCAGVSIQYRYGYWVHVLTCTMDDMYIYMFGTCTGQLFPKNVFNFGNVHFRNSNFGNVKFRNVEFGNGVLHVQQAGQRLSRAHVQGVKSAHKTRSGDSDIRVLGIHVPVSAIELSETVKCTGHRRYKS